MKRLVLPKRPEMSEIEPSRLDEEQTGLVCSWNKSNIGEKMRLSFLTKRVAGNPVNDPKEEMYGFCTASLGKFRSYQATFKAPSTEKCVTLALEAKRDVRQFDSWHELATAISRGSF